MPAPLRVLLLADTHLGFDLPFRPRVERRRRGPDFFANFERALEPARRGEVDAVVHGGDLFFRSQVPPALVEQAFTPLAAAARGGVPVFVVPGNHERSRLPCPILAAHKDVFVFDRPRTFALRFAGGVAALAGFPFARDAGSRFPALLEETGHHRVDAQVRLLCLHQAIEGARVGTPEFVFRPSHEVIRGRDLPAGFAAVLSGHVHRAQRLTADLAGRPLRAPVFYPGSIERTSFAERREPKGCALLHFEPSPGGAPAGGRLLRAEWRPLPARPMARVAIDPRGLSCEAVERLLREALAALPPASVVRVDLAGAPLPCALPALTAARLRALAPPEMTVDLGWPRERPVP